MRESKNTINSQILNNFILTQNNINKILRKELTALTTRVEKLENSKQDQ